MPSSTIQQEARSLLRGLGQIMLQPNALTGLLFLIGIAVNNWLFAGCALLGAGISTLTGKTLRIGRDALHEGLYGFNGALVGIAVAVNCSPSPVSLLLLAMGSVLSSLILYTSLRWLPRLPPYTMPFIVAAWLILVLVHTLALNPAHNPALPSDNTALITLIGLGQVMFQENWLSGLLFLLGLTVHDRQAAAWALIGSALGYVTALALGFPDAPLLAGLYGFNGALTGIALAGRYNGNAALALTGIVLSTVLIRAFQLAELPALTAPFVLATWLCVLCHGVWKKVAASS